MSTRARPNAPPSDPLIIDPHRLGAPTAEHEIVAHDRLVAMRPPAEDAPVVLVDAPAGYGKSTLVSEWAAHAQTPVIWLSTDRYLSDPVSLVAHIAVATMRAVGPDPSLEAAVSRPSATVWSSFVPRLGAVLRRAGPYLMVLDDIHALATPASRDVIDWLALRVPTGSQLVLSGRTMEGLRSGSLRLRGDAVAFGTDDLSLTDAEALELLRKAGIASTPLEAQDVNRRCAGWVSGLLMIAASRSSGPGSASSSVPATASDLVAEYLDAEILAHLSGAKREFVERASLLWTMTASLCDAALERDDSVQQLEELCTSNAFVTRLADGSCKQHELIRFALRSRIEREQPEACAGILRRAAAWHADHGEPDAAVKYAQRSGDHELACRLIGSFAVVLMSLGRMETLTSWFDWVERNDLVTIDPATTDSGVHIFALTGAPQRSERWASIMQTTAERAKGLDRARWEPHASLVAAWQCRLGSATMLESATRASELLDPDDPLYMSAVGALGIAQLMCGQDEAGMRTMQRIADERPANVDENAVTVAQVLLARAAMAQGDLDGAWQLLQRAGERRHRLGMSEQCLHALYDAVCARVMLARGEAIEDVQPLLTHAQTVRPQSTWAMPGLAMPIRLELAKAYLGLNDVAGARVVIREAFDILHRRPGLGAMEAEAKRLRNIVATQGETVSGPSALTSAELRLVPWLATHLSFREIGERLFLSTNTVKTEALSTYRKLGVSSRSAAVEAAVKAGLLDPASLPGILHADAWRDVDREDPAVHQR